MYVYEDSLSIYRGTVKGGTSSYNLADTTETCTTETWRLLLMAKAADAEDLEDVYISVIFLPAKKAFRTSVSSRLTARLIKGGKTPHSLRQLQRFLPPVATGMSNFLLLDADAFSN